MSSTHANDVPRGRVTVRGLVGRPPVTLPPTATAREAADLMKSFDIGNVVVVDGDQVVGIVTDRDLALRVVATGGTGQEPVGQVASPSPVVIAAESTIDAAARMMAMHAVRRLPVVEEGRIVGVVSLGDLAGADRGAPCSVPSPPRGPGRSVGACGRGSPERTVS
jgi:CBS domain-containing protein